MLTTAVTFLFTDVEGSTRLFERLPAFYPAAIRRHHVLLREAVESHGGEIFETVGDAVCAVFPSTTAAIAAAIDGQRALRREHWGEIGELKVRAGIHRGAAELRDGRYVGPAVVEADRVMSSAHGGQIVASGAATAALELETGTAGPRLQHLGQHRLKGNLSVDLHQVCSPDLPDSFPALRTLTHLIERLPAYATALIGREDDLAAIVDLLGRDRLVSLVGPAGAGKTRLAAHAGHLALDRFSDGLWFIDLSRDSSPLFDAFARDARELMGRTAPGEPSLEASLVRALQGKQALLIVDGCETALAEVAALVAALLRGCHHLHLLVTTRESLGVGSERQYRVGGLATVDPNELPADPAHRVTTVAATEAGALFLDRVRRGRPDFVFDHETAHAFARLSNAIDALPRAIEAAAARVLEAPDSSSATTSTRLLEDTAVRELSAPEHRLTDEERLLLTKLAVLPAGFRLDEAEAAATDAIDALDILDLLAKLEDEGSITVDRSKPDEPRYRCSRRLRGWLHTPAQR